MRIIKSKKQFDDFYAHLKKRASGTDMNVVNSVTKIIEDVKGRGDEALFFYTEKFDKYITSSLKITADLIDEYAQKAESDFLEALKVSFDRIKAFHERQLEKSWNMETQGAITGQIVSALQRVGVYVPGGKASYPSTVLMSVIPAIVAGVRQVVVCVPLPNGIISPYVMAALKLTGVTEAYSVGGAQAVAALAYGTETIKPVDKIVGPGNVYVATAKKLVFGDVDIDMFAGPSEVLVVADAKANPRFIAADMLSQAEHDELASAILITTSEEILKQVERELECQLPQLVRKEIALKSIENYTALILTENMDEAFSYVNKVAPEHLEIMTENARDNLRLLKHAGAVFLGDWTPEALGDYSAGPNHTLPTSGTARFFSPLGVYDFQKRTSLISFTKEAFDGISKTVETLASYEGLQGHANSVRVRLS